MYSIIFPCREARWGELWRAQTVLLESERGEECLGYWKLWLGPMDTCTKQHFSSLLISSKVYLLSIIPHSDAVRPILVDSLVLFFSQSFCDFSVPSLELASPALNLPFVILYTFWSFGLQEFHICIPSIPHFPPWTLARMDCDAFFMDPKRTIDSVIAMYSFLMESTRGKIGKPRADGGFIDWCYIPLINASPQCQIWRTATIIVIYGFARKRNNLELVDSTGVLTFGHHGHHQVITRWLETS